MIRSEHLTCLAEGSADPRRAIADVSITVEAGEIVAVVGAPDDGPGTLLRALASLVPWAAGRVVREDVPPGRGRPLPGFGYIRAGLSGPGDLAVLEWLRHVADHRGGPAPARAVRVQAAMGLVALAPIAERRIALLDRDAIERLAVATVAVSGALAVFLDGCFAGVHAATRRILGAAVADLATQGRAILLAPQDVRAVEDIATRVIVLRQGRVTADLRMAALQRERVAELRMSGGAIVALPRLIAHFPDAVRTGTGLDVPLPGGRTLESVLAVCRSERIPVLGSHVRYVAVDDLLRAERPLPDPARVAALG